MDILSWVIHYSILLCFLIKVIKVNCALNKHNEHLQEIYKTVDSITVNESCFFDPLNEWASGLPQFKDQGYNIVNDMRKLIRQHETNTS